MSTIVASENMPPLLNPKYATEYYYILTYSFEKQTDDCFIPTLYNFLLFVAPDKDFFEPQGAGQGFLFRSQGAGQGFLFRPQGVGHIFLF